MTSFAARSARYVRVQGVTRATQYGISFYEARVLGPPVTGGDTTPPDTTITGGPEGSSASAAASFTFTANESGSSFDCRLDGGAWTRCTSPYDIAGLADGQHTFAVRATDPAGNVDPSPASRTWSVATSTTGENLALNRTATASSTEASGLGPANAVDGNAATRWSSSYAEDQWWQVDLGSVKQVSRVELDWEGAYASSYRILTSTDGTNFSAAADDTATGAGFEATAFAARSARYVRVLALTRGTQWGVSFFEARVFGPATSGDTTPPETTITAGPAGTVSTASASFEFASNETGSSFECRLDGGAWSGCVSPRQLTGLADGSHSFDVRATDQAGNVDASPASRSWTVSTVAESADLAQGQPATASSSEASGLGPANAVDGNPATRWSSSYADDQWWQVDLGSVKQVSRVELDWEGAYASSYEILVSSDGTSFAQAATASASGPGARSTSFSARSARYVRVHALTRATQWGISFFSAKVFGPAGGGGDSHAAPDDAHERADGHRRLGVRELRLRLQRGRLELPVPPRRRRLGRLQLAEGLRRPRQRRAHVRRARHRRRRQRRRHARHAHVDRERRLRRARARDARPRQLLASRAKRRAPAPQIRRARTPAPTRAARPRSPA